MAPLNIHFVGIGGIGISALARYYRAKGVRVTGSDAACSEITDDLKREGIKIVIGHAATNIKNPDLVVFSAAARQNNPELIAARKKGIPAKTYAEALGELTKQYFTIAVAGSHGKSTTTALIGLILTRAGLDPTVIVGTKLREFAPPAGGSNFRAGKSQYLVIEADEWNRSFHHHYPRIAVVTNVDREHLDTYKTLAGVKQGFLRFLRNVSSEGVAVVNYRDRGTREAVGKLKAKKQPRRLLGSGLRPQASEAPKIIWYNRRHFRLHPLFIPGAHNQTNAEAAWQVAKYLGIKKSVADQVFRSYQGSWRRLERLNPKRSTLNAILYSDYAHHPTEIKATLAGLREKYPKKRIIAVFQPHLADRLNSLFQEFTRAFGDADKLIVLPVYKVAGRHTERERTSLDLVKAIFKKNVHYAKDFATLRTMLREDFRTPSIIVCMSAGDLDAEARRW